MFFSAAILKQ